MTDREVYGDEKSRRVNDELADGDTFTISDGHCLELGKGSKVIDTKDSRGICKELSRI